MTILKIFSKKLTKTDVENRLSVTTRSLSYFPPFEKDKNYQDIMVEDDDGYKWPLRLTIRRGKYRKPVISAAGWLHFARIKQLHVGFKVKFFKEEDKVPGEMKYKVKLKKPCIVFKATLGYVSHCSAN